MSRRDTVIILGGGVNGLTAAAFLAQAGRRVVLLEQRAFLGGTAAAEEFHPGYTSAGLWHDVSSVRPWIVEELKLEKHGLRQQLYHSDTLVLGENDTSLLLRDQFPGASEEIAKLSHKDASAYRAFREFLATIKPAVTGFLDHPPVDMIRPESESKLEMLRRGWDLRRLGAENLLEIFRLPPMSVEDWMREQFETEILRAGLAFPALFGAYMGPRSPQSNANLVLGECARSSAVQGGGPALVAALAASARAAGAELRTESEVARLRVGPGGVDGVELTNGEILDATCVLSTLEPKRTLLGLLDPATLPVKLYQNASNWRTRGVVAHLLLALNRPLTFTARPNDRIARAFQVGSLTSMEQAFDAVKYRQRSTTPALDIHLPTVADPSLAPANHEVVSVLVYFAPYDLEGGWTDDARESLTARVVELLEQTAPGAADSLVAHSLRTPADLETVFGLSGGHLHHGEVALDQILVRPAPSCIKYATPVPGLFLGGGGSHPGGGPTGAPGAHAARALLSR